MKLGELVDLDAGPVRAAGRDGWREVVISGVTSDSRTVGPGMLFVAVAGAKADGASFVPAAVAAGAAAVVAGEAGAIGEIAVPLIRTRDPRRLLALVAARLHGGQPDVVVAVTGTSGKSSVAEFTRQIFAACGRKAASIGTIGVIKPDGGVYGSLTTPDPVTLHRSLHDLAAEGVTHVAFEASSHGLDQRRLDGVRVTAAAYTNLGRDHLDYHPTVESYLAAKLRLFETLLPAGGTAVVNADGAHAEAVIAVARRRGMALITVGTGAAATIRLAAATTDGFGQRLTVHYAGREHVLSLSLIGTYQASNALLAAGLAIAAGEAPESALTAIETLTGVSGRLEIVGSLRGGLVVVDYAHKPDALLAALEALRPFAPGRLIVVFGCGGDRDRGKRPIMGAIAIDKADVTIVTDDNPRSEDPAAIRAEIVAAAPGAIEIGDRALAIRTAIGMTAPGDVVLIAGKGHETGQIVGDRVLPFSDQDAARACINGELSHD